MRRSFKIGDFVKCINNKYTENYLTLNKIYKILDIDEDHFQYKGDDCISHWSACCLFEKVNLIDSKY